MCVSVKRGGVCVCMKSCRDTETGGERELCELEGGTIWLAGGNVGGVSLSLLASCSYKNVDYSESLITPSFTIKNQFHLFYSKCVCPGRMRP